ncbi:dTDP-4-dehydrorhamnose reductase [Marinobacterium mangrovicola]|uniref:dTDP-4-dehydrorhamnose reductase n=1 Tax=Marinobacterium mangrovicola TaxID=1476959 RepID=A0A4R1GG51_9GAMM|nr:dTDP-4-dehydrorhamnose reductase [Marinobacterium mangrovicola]TCK07244.1 dTDP-4-dehydrorhamnose reductase [Marinobacterium mangrovicola]
MKILITGGNGQVGFELQRSLALFGEVLVPTRQKLDLASHTAVEDYLQTHHPGLIINAAAYTAVDKAESEPDKARRLNAQLPSQLAAYAKANDILLVHYSSDYVYPGIGDKPFSEDAETGPLGVYGQTKLEGDEAITANGCRHLIFRTSWVYSARGNNFMKTMLRLAKDKNGLNIVADQVGAPTPARLIANVTAHAVARSLPSGTYHLAPKGSTSWHGFAQAIFKLAKEKGEELKVGPEQAHPIPTSEYPTPAQRPLNSRLNLSKLETALNVQLPDWQSQLQLTLGEYLEE